MRLVSDKKQDENNLKIASAEKSKQALSVEFGSPHSTLKKAALTEQP